MMMKPFIKASASLAAGVCAIAALATCTDAGSGSGSRDEVSNPSAASTLPPTIQLDSPNDHPRQRHHLQFGNDNDTYWMEDTDWGAARLTEGTAPDQYEQNVGASPQTGPNGEVAFRIKWRWPQGTTEVKGYPAVLSGRKPGFYSSDHLVNGQPIRLLDGSLSKTAPSGDTPGTFMPMQLPIPALTATFARSDISPPTGQGQLTFALWLQSHPGQDHEFGSSSITHEIMIPLDNWGSHGAYPNGRNPRWYDHDAVINGRLYHVYCTKGSDGVLRYDFGGLDGTYGRAGWKMIVFQPDTPVPAGELDLAAFINYLQTRGDVAGTPWAQGNEYLVSVELGVEPVVGSGDIVVYDYKLSPTPPSRSKRVQAEDAALSGSGVSVKADLPGYEGSGFVGPFSRYDDRATVSFTHVAAGTYDVRIRYHARTQQVNNVVVNNGTTHWSALFPATGSSWGVKTLSGVALAAGTNTVAIIKDSGHINVDSIEIVPGGSGDTSTATRKQVENGSLIGVKIVDRYPGYEGRGAVGPFSHAGDRATVSFTHVSAGTYDIRIRYHSDRFQQNDVAINGFSKREAFDATGSTGWGIKTLSRVALAAGTNTIAIIRGWGWLNVDYIEIAPSSP